MIDVKQIYAENPKFQSDFKALAIDNELTYLFNKSYKILSEIDNTKPVQLKHGKKCIKIIDKIFDCLTSESIDQYESEFYNELKGLSKSYLSTYIEWIIEGKKNSASFSEISKLGEDLKQNLHVVGSIAEKDLALILNSLSAPIGILQERIKNGETRREYLTISSYFNLGPTLKILNKAFIKNGINNAVSSYMGRKYKVGGAALEISPKNAQWWQSINLISSEAAYAHVDESITNPKAILYLTDVDALNGPTSYYPGLYEKLLLSPLQEIIGRVIGCVGSMPRSKLNNYYKRDSSFVSSSKEFRCHFMRLPNELKFNSHLGWDIARGSKVEKEFIQSERQLKGHAGAYIVFDGGKLFHRGGMVKSGERIALQIIFEEASLKATIIKKIKSIKLKIIKRIT
jgi:hypothetical protein